MQKAPTAATSREPRCRRSRRRAARVRRAAATAAPQGRRPALSVAHRADSSIELRPALLAELRPLVKVGAHEAAKLLWRAADRLRAVRHDALAHLRLVQDLYQLLVQPRDDRLRQARRADHAVPADHLK